MIDYEKGKKRFEIIRIEMPTFETVSADLPGVIPGKRLTLNERIIFSMLYKARGRIVRNQSFMDAIYIDRPDDFPNEDIIKVWISKLRKKIAGITIYSYHRIGYAMLINNDAISLEKIKINKISMANEPVTKPLGKQKQRRIPSLSRR
jgi:hypothetical protein